MLASHFQDGRPLKSASACGIYVACPAAWCILQLVPPRRQQSRVLAQGTTQHADANAVLGALLTGQPVPAVEDADGAAMAYAAHQAILHFTDGAEPDAWLAEERLTHDGYTVQPDLAVMASRTLVVMDFKRSLDDPHLPQASVSTQLLVQSGMLLEHWPPAAAADHVAVAYVTPDGADWADTQDRWTVMVRWEALRASLDGPPRLEYHPGPQCSRCPVAHVCPAVQGEPVFDDLQLLSHAELGAALTETKAKAAGLEAKLDTLKEEVFGRLDAGADPALMGWRIRQDSTWTIGDPVGFLRRHDIALESVVPALSRSKAQQLLAERAGGQLTPEQQQAIEQACTERKKARFLFACKKP